MQCRNCKTLQFQTQKPVASTSAGCRWWTRQVLNRAQGTLSLCDFYSCSDMPWEGMIVVTSVRPKYYCMRTFIILKISLQSLYIFVMYCYVSLTELWLCFLIFPHKLQREQEISWPSSHDDLLKHSQLGFLWVYQDISRLKTATVMKDLEIGDSPQKETRRNAKAKETFSYIFMKQAFANV